MDATQSCELLRQNLFKSGLHFFVNESPFSLWITIRKKFISGEATVTTIKNQDTIKHETRSDDDYDENRYKSLVDDFTKLSEAYEAVKVDLETEIGDHRGSIDELRKFRAEDLRKDDLILSLKKENQEMKEEIESVNENQNKAKKEIKVEVEGDA